MADQEFREEFETHLRGRLSDHHSIAATFANTLEGYANAISGTLKELDESENTIRKLLDQSDELLGQDGFRYQAELELQRVLSDTSKIETVQCLNGKFLVMFVYKASHSRQDFVPFDDTSGSAAAAAEDVDQRQNTDLAGEDEDERESGILHEGMVERSVSELQTTFVTRGDAFDALKRTRRDSEEIHNGLSSTPPLTKRCKRRSTTTPLDRRQQTKTWLKQLGASGSRFDHLISDAAKTSGQFLTALRGQMSAHKLSYPMACCLANIRAYNRVTGPRRHGIRSNRATETGDFKDLHRVAFRELTPQMLADIQAQIGPHGFLVPVGEASQADVVDLAFDHSVAQFKVGEVAADQPPQYAQVEDDEEESDSE